MLKALTPKLAGWLFAVALPTCHVYVIWCFWARYKVPVDTVDCTCSCWDTIFKGPYEGGIASYKHFYFNATKTTTKIWIIIATGVILLYECIRYLVHLLLTRKLRFSMLILFLMSLFPHYYSWWVYINYYNDSFYVQWRHQLSFTITELISTISVLYLANKKNRIRRRLVLLIVAISLIHIYISGIDQFVQNVFLLQGYSHQIARDFGLMVPDLLHTIFPIIEYFTEKHTDLGFHRKCKIHFIKELLLTIIFVIVACYYVSANRKL